MTTVEKPKWYIVGEKGTFVKYGSDPQEAVMAEGGDVEKAREDAKYYGKIVRSNKVSYSILSTQSLIEYSIGYKRILIFVLLMSY